MGKLGVPGSGGKHAVDGQWRGIGSSRGAVYDSLGAVVEMNLGIGAMEQETVGRLTAPVCVREDGGPLPL